MDKFEKGLSLSTLITFFKGDVISYDNGTAWKLTAEDKELITGIIKEKMDECRSNRR